MTNKIRQIHNEAMDLAQMGQIATRQGDAEKAESMFAQAFEKEREAAMMAFHAEYPQPGLSILLQSAAHLAMTSQRQREAEKLIGLALAGDVPSEIRHDLRGLLASIGNTEGKLYDTYAIQIPVEDKGMLSALNLMLTRLGCSMKKIAVL